MLEFFHLNCPIPPADYGLLCWCFVVVVLQPYHSVDQWISQSCHPLYDCLKFLNERLDIVQCALCSPAFWLSGRMLLTYSRLWVCDIWYQKRWLVCMPRSSVHKAGDKGWGMFLIPINQLRGYVPLLPCNNGVVGMGNRTPNVPKSPVTIFVNRVDCVANGGTTLRIHCPMKFIFPYLEEVGGMEVCAEQPVMSCQG